MLEEKPEDRFQTPRILAEALKPWAERSVPPFPLTVLECSRQRYHLALGRAPESDPISVRKTSPFAQHEKQLGSNNHAAAVQA